MHLSATSSSPHLPAIQGHREPGRHGHSEEPSPTFPALPPNILHPMRYRYFLELS